MLVMKVNINGMKTKIGILDDADIIRDGDYFLTDWVKKFTSKNLNNLKVDELKSYIESATLMPVRSVSDGDSVLDHDSRLFIRKL